MRPIRPKTPLKTPSKSGPNTKPKPNLNNRDNNKAKEPVEVFCRLRPLSNCADLVAVQKVLNNDNLIRLCPPNGSTNLFFKFKHVFDQNISQKELFDSVALPLVTDLINGKNGLLFTYGITCSGKTHTIIGTPEDSGILPRSLDVIFNSLNNNNLQSRKYIFKPDGLNYFKIQSTPDALLQWQKERSVAKTPSTPAFTPRTPRTTKKKDNGTDWESRVKEDSIIEEINCDNSYAVFISHVEIYNNYIYDLLDDSIDSIKTSRQPLSKVLREDNRRRVFVNGGIELEVKSADEAFEVFMKGIRRRRIANTNLNTHSSRSHSVFTIRLVQAPLDSNGTEVIQDERFLVTSQLSIVDLAGSERTLRTQNTGDRLREAGNINNSLMALRNCIDILRDNQLNGGNRVVPYRDNKLTNLFKSYFEGEGGVKMVICVNPSADDFDETLHVMKFAEHSQDVLVSRGFNPMNRINRETFPKFYENVGGVDLVAINIVGPPFPTSLLEDPEDDKVFPEWLECLESRKRNKESKFEKLKEIELSVRQRVAQIESENMHYRQQVSVMQMDLEAREHQVKELENKCFQTERICETNLKKISDYDRNLKTLESSLEEKNRLLSHSELEKERMKAKMREKLDAERDRLKGIFERLLAEKQAQLEREQCVSKDKMNLVKQILNADNTNWEFLRENREVFYPVSQSGIRQSSGPSNGIDSQASTQTPQQVLKRKSEYDLAHYGTPLPVNQCITASNKSSTPQTVGSIGQEGVPSHNPPPVVNPRHRRSLSSGSEKWIDHRPKGTLDLGTVLKSKIKNKKSVCNLKSLDILKDASKYALTHHEADLRGQVETQIFKGEVIPSSSGGAQVIFNDVETMKQGSPPLRKRTVSDTRLLSPQSGSNQVITETELHNQPVNPFSKRSRR